MAKNKKQGMVEVAGYTRKDGTKVASHKRTMPDGDPSNNKNA